MWIILIFFNVWKKWRYSGQFLNNTRKWDKEHCTQYSSQESERWAATWDVRLGIRKEATRGVWSWSEQRSTCEVVIKQKKRQNLLEEQYFLKWSSGEWSEADFPIVLLFKINTKAVKN
jgi:hypothetical protein